MQPNQDALLQSVATIVGDLKTKPGALLPILHRIQDEHGHIPEGAIEVIASGLNLSRAEVHGVIGFYHDFRREPPGLHVLRVCQAESCQAMGSDALTDHIKTRLGIDFRETSADSQFTLEPVYCLGNCACSPALMVDDVLYGRMNEQRFDAVVDAVKAGR